MAELANQTVLGKLSCVLPDAAWFIDAILTQLVCLFSI